MTNSIDEVKDADVIFIIGSNTTEQHPLIGMRVAEAVKKNGAKLLVADPRRIPVSNYAHTYASIRPGGNLALVNSMLNVIITEGLENREFIGERTENFEEFAASVERYTPEWAEPITGIPADTIREMARVYARAKNAVTCYAMGVTQHVTGTKTVRALANLALLTGQIGKESSGVLPLRGQNNVQGSCDMGCLPDNLPGYQKFYSEATKDTIGAVWGEDFADGRGLTVTEMMQVASKGDIKALYIVGENPILSDADLEHVKHAFKNIELVIVQDIFMTETAEIADVVLPGCSFMEKDGTFTNTERRVQRVRKAIEPVGNSRPDWMIVADIINGLGGEANFNDPSEIMEEINKVVPSYAGISYDRLEKEGGLQWPCTTANHPGTKFLHRGKFARGLGQFTVNEYITPGEMRCDEYPFILTTGRTHNHYHTGTMTRRSWTLDREQPKGFIEMHPEDAKKIGAKSHWKIRVSSRRGSILTEAIVTDRIQQGVLFMPMHFAEEPVNILTNSNLDPDCLIPELKVCAVNIEVVD